MFVVKSKNLCQSNPAPHIFNGIVLSSSHWYTSIVFFTVSILFWDLISIILFGTWHLEKRSALFDEIQLCCMKWHLRAVKYCYAIWNLFATNEKHQVKVKCEISRLRSKWQIGRDLDVARNDNTIMIKCVPGTQKNASVFQWNTICFNQLLHWQRRCF